MHIFICELYPCFLIIIYPVNCVTYILVCTLCLLLFPIFVVLSTSFYVTVPEPVLLSDCFLQLVWPFIFMERSDYDIAHTSKRNLVLFVYSIILILTTLFQKFGVRLMALSCVSPVLICLFDRYAFHNMIMLYHLCLILVGPGIRIVKGSKTK